MGTFAFNLSESVCIIGGAETGEIVGRAEYTNSCNKYLVRYVAGDGRAVEAWWDEDALLPVPENKA